MSMLDTCISLSLSLVFSKKTGAIASLLSMVVKSEKAVCVVLHRRYVMYV